MEFEGLAECPIIVDLQLEWQWNETSKSEADRKIKGERKIEEEVKTMKIMWLAGEHLLSSPSIACNWKMIQ
jgi:hypothetical protein